MKLRFKTLQLDVTYDYTQAERRTLEYPGCDEDWGITMEEEQE